MILPISTETEAFLQRVRQGDRQALDDLLAQHRGWVRHIVNVRLDPRVRRRVDPSDVVQEVQLQVAKRIDDYLSREPMPFHLWLRQTAYDNLIQLRRKHVLAEGRSVEKEVFLTERSSLHLAQVLLAQDNPPDQHMIEEELSKRLHAALEELPETDREIVLMRVCEGLENQDVSQLLEIHPSTGSKRFGRALLQLRAKLLSQDSQGAGS